MGTSESKYREEFLRPYAKNFEFDKIENPVLQYRVKFLHQHVLDKLYPGDNLMKTAVVKYYVMLNRMADYDLASRKEELERVPRCLLDEALVQFLTMEIWCTLVNGEPGHKPLVEIIGAMPVVTYD